MTCNPYESPAAADEHMSWWGKIRRMLQPTPAIAPPDFANGDAILCDGIAFSIDTENPQIAYAASPSADLSERRMNLVVAEAVRVLPLLLVDHPELCELLRGRKLTVRLVDHYSDLPLRFRREVRLEWDIIQAVLSDPLEGGTAG